jgi:4'-phosphopantetheinyl transferase
MNLGPIRCKWLVPSAHVKLVPGEIHLWLASLQLNSASMQRMWRTLDGDERTRALRFHFAKDRCDFTAARGILRDILSRYLGRPSSKLRFQYGESGKPELRARTGEEKLNFNTSHSHGLAVYAVTRGAEVGVDLEKVRPAMLRDSIPERFFSATEATELRSLPRRLQPRSFFQTWTQKEALAKAQGQGLASLLEISPGRDSRIDPTIPIYSDSLSWTTLPLSPAPGYIGAIASNHEISRLRFWRWQEADVCEARNARYSDVPLETTELMASVFEMETLHDEQADCLW